VGSSAVVASMRNIGDESMPGLENGNLNGRLLQLQLMTLVPVISQMGYVPSGTPKSVVSRRIEIS